MKIISLDKGAFAFILGLLLWYSHANANIAGTASWQSTVSGTVSDAAGPLPGVTVQVKGSSSSAVTDGKGQYTIAAAIGDTLVFSFVGFRQTELVVSSANADVVLQEDTAQLQEVVINAGYYSVRDKERTGSIARITAEQIKDQPVTNVLAAMQGRMAGVDIVQASGVSGGSFDVKIRGQNSIRADGNSPLYIIDGVPYASETVGFERSNVVQPYNSSPLNSFNPSEIESIEVLKDADATAIYGSRGANGVVLVTTKKGRAGKTQFNVSATTGFGSVANFVDLMDTRQYLEMRNEAFANDGISPGAADYDVNGTWDPNRYTDWQEEFLGGTMQYTDLQASVSGGSRTSQFLVASGIRKETTVFPGDFGYGKANVRVNFNHASDDERFRLSFSAGYTSQKNDQPGIDLTRTALTLAPNAPALYDAAGNLNFEGSTWDNPLGLLRGKYLSSTEDLLANALLSYAVTPEITVKSSFGFTDTRYLETRTQPSSMYNPEYMMTAEYATLVRTDTGRKSWIVEPQVTWKRTIGRGEAEALVGASFQDRRNETLSQEATDFSSDALIYNLASAGILVTLQDIESAYRYQAFFGRINYNWDKRYIVNLTGRRDGSSRFGPGKQYATFGAVGAAWLFSNERLFSEKESVLSFGKLRGSFGTSGNDQIGDYQFMDTYATVSANYGGVVGLGPTRLYNRDFSWETNRKLEAAIELGFFRDRIMLTAAWYRNRSSSQLVGIPLPLTTGFNSIQANLDAEVENRGYEFTLNTLNLDASGFTWRTDFNIALSRNELLSFPNLEGSTYRNQLMIGEALNIRKMYQFTGIDPETGLYQFRDYNGDGAVTAADDRMAVVDLNPEFFGGLRNQLNYKGWQLDFLLQFVKQRNYGEDYGSGIPGRMNNQPVTVYDRWQQAGGQGGFQRYTTGTNSAAVDAYNKYLASDAIITDASYIRLKNISLSYSIPEKWLPGMACRLHVEAQNLLTFTPYKGADPEFRASGYLPPLRMLSGGVNLSF